MLIEIEGCIFLKDELGNSHGYESLDAVGQEAFVNHIHLDGSDHESEAGKWVQDVTEALKHGWPSRSFRIYRQTDPRESTVRFHMVRESQPNWCEQDLEGIEIIEVLGRSQRSTRVPNTQLFTCEWFPTL